jgi:hypothetical protein
VLRHDGCGAPIIAERRCTAGHGPSTERETTPEPGPERSQQPELRSDARANLASPASHDTHSHTRKRRDQTADSPAAHDPRGLERSRAADAHERDACPGRPTRPRGSTVDFDATLIATPSENDRAARLDAGEEPVVPPRSPKGSTPCTRTVQPVRRRRRWAACSGGYARPYFHPAPGTAL